MTSQIELITGGVRITGEMTVYATNQLKQSLLDALDGGPANVQVDLSRVSEFDTAGLQLLLLARREALSKGRTLRLGIMSNVVRETLGLCGALKLLVDGPIKAERP